MRASLANVVGLVLVVLLVPGGAPSAAAQTAPAVVVAPEASATPSAFRPELAPDPAKVETALRSAPVMFIENVGQFAAPPDDPDRVVPRFQVRGGQGVMHLTPDALWVTLLVPQAATSGTLAQPAAEELTGVTLRLSFVGANPNPQLVGFDRLETTISYFRGDESRWRPAVPVWGGVRYVDLYPGIDLEVTSQGGQIVQRLAVRDEAQLGNVRLRVEGASSLSIDGHRISIATEVGTYSLPLLEVSSTQVKRGYAPVVTGNEIAQPLSALGTGPDLPNLVIDRPDFWSTFLGGSNMDWGVAIDVDALDNVYVTGSTFSVDFPTTPGPFQTYRGHYDVFVSKFDPALSALSYSAILGATGGGVEDRGYGIAVKRTASGGQAYVVGVTKGAGFPVTSGAYDTTYNDGDFPWGDAFLARLNETGTGLLYGTYLGGSEPDEARAIAIDASGWAHISGSTGSSNFPTTRGAYDRTHNGGDCGQHALSDGFVAKLNPVAFTGLGYGTFLGGSGCDHGTGIALDSTSNAYVTGDTPSPNFPHTSGAFQESFGGNWDAYMVKLRLGGGGAGDLLYATYLGGSDQDKGQAIAVDSSGDAYLVGCAVSGFPTTPGAYSEAPNGGWDLFVAKLHPAGGGQSDLQYGTYLGSTEDDEPGGGNSIYVDASGSAYVTGKVGNFGALNFRTTNGAVQTTFGGFGDGFIVKLAASGGWLMYSTFLGGSDSDSSHGIARNSLGQVYVAGSTFSTDFPVSPGGFDQSYNSGGDAFVTGLDLACGNQADTDADALLDGWELCGYYDPGGGFVDLPKMKASPFKKDIFVEIDYIRACIIWICPWIHRPDDLAMATVRTAFLGAPVENPDRSLGIVLRVDYGPDTIMDPWTGKTWGDLSRGGQEIEGGLYLVPLRDPGEPWDGFDEFNAQYRAVYFDPERARIFHYAMFAHELGGNAEPGTSGIAYMPGDELIVALGTFEGGVGSSWEQAGTLMHELGHNLGLDHGGNEGLNYKPNYLSIMSYSFQMHGLIRFGDDGWFDYSRFGPNMIGDLDETNLDESRGIPADPSVEEWGTRYWCALGEQRIPNPFNQPVDWNCNGLTDPPGLAVSINNDAPLNTLIAWDDWSALVYDGGAIGPTSPGRLMDIPIEATVQTLSRSHAPYAVILSGDSGFVGSPGAIASMPITLTNRGGLTATVALTVTIGRGWFDTTAVPYSVSVPPGGTVSLPIHLRLPTHPTGQERSDVLILHATPLESPRMGDVVNLYAWIEPLARFDSRLVSGNAPLTATFTDKSRGTVTSWRWDFGDGATSSLRNPEHTYLTPGFYTVTLTVTGTYGSDTTRWIKVVRVR